MSTGYNSSQTYNATLTYAGLTAPVSLSTSIRSAMQAILRTVPGILGENWWYQRLTSGPAAEARTYAAMTVVAVHVTGRTTLEEYDDRRQMFVRKERARMRLSDALADLHQGDQVIDQTGLVYAVRGIEASGVGTIAYTIERDLPLVASPPRNGGV